MRNIDIQAKINLKISYYDNELYIFSSEEKELYNGVIDEINNDYGYYDLVMDFNNYNELEPLFESLSSLPKYVEIKKMVTMQFVLSEILKKAEILDLSDNFKKGDLRKIIGSTLLGVDDVLNSVKTKAKVACEKQYARIICLLDNVNDPILQQCINDLFACRSEVAIIGYTTNDLASYLTTKNVLLDKNHDCKLYISDKKMSELKKGGRKKL